MKQKMRNRMAMLGMSGLMLSCGMFGFVNAAQASEVTLENAPTVKVVIPVLGTQTEGAAAIEEKVNEILVEKAGAKIEITWSDFGNLQQQINMMLTNSSELDIAYIYGGPRTYANNGQLYDMTELMEAEGEGIRELIGDQYIEASKVDGQIVYIPTQVDRSQEICCIVNAKMLQEMGVEADDSKIWTLDEIHDLTAKAMELHPGIYGIVPGAGGSNLIGRLNYDGLGDTYNVGVVENRGESQTVVSITECEEYIEFSRLMRQWYLEGLIMPDILSNSEAGQSMIFADKAFGMFVSGCCPDGIEDESSPRRILTIQSQWVGSDASERMGYIMNAQTKYPTEAFRVLKEMYLNEEIKTLLSFGIEGENYVLDEQGRAAYPEGVTAETAVYNVGFVTWFVFPDGQCDIVPYTNAPDYWTRQAEYEKEAEISPLLGCIFDPTPVADSYAACSNVYSQYYDAILSGAIDTEEGLAEYSKALKDAGEDIVLAEKQKQVDEFLAN